MAAELVDLFVGVACFRISSMLWHSHCWPGLSVLLCSSDETVFRTVLALLRSDYRSFLNAVQKGQSSSYVLKMVRTSPFGYRFMRELATIVTTPVVGITFADLRHSIRKFICHVFTGWGQTKICEDMFKEMRQREQQDTLNLIRNMPSHYASMHEMEVISKHKREEVKVHPLEKPAAGTAKKTFSTKDHTCSLPDYRQITNKATWPTFSPQSSKRVYADLWLTRYIDEHDLWQVASKSWQAELLRPRTIIMRVSDQEYFLVLGALANLVVMAWKVDHINITSTNNLAFLIGAGKVINYEVVLLPAIDLEKYLIVPTQPVCPLHYYLACKKKLSNTIGVVLLQYKKPIPVMLHMAENAFFDIGLPQLKIICQEWSIETPCLLLPSTVTAAARFFY